MRRIILISLALISISVSGQDLMARQAPVERRTVNNQTNRDLDIVKAADMVLDANVFGTAHTILAMHGMPVNDRATDEFAKRQSKDNFEYHDQIATNAYVYWPEYQRDPNKLFIARLTSYGPNQSDIKELFFTLGNSYQAKFYDDLPLYGYKKIKSENKKDKDFNVSYLETVYEKGSHFCTIKTMSSGSTIMVSFTRKERKESDEEREISERCRRFIRLHGIDGARQYSITDMNAPYEVPAMVDCQFPAENTLVNISKSVLEKEAEPVRKRFEVSISGSGTLSIDSYQDKEKALFEWIKPYINVKSTAKVNFPRYGKGFVIGDSFYLTIDESEEEDSCTLSFKVKYKSGNEFILRNQKDLESQLASVYGDSEMLSSIWASFPCEEMAHKMYFIGYTYIVKVHIFKRKVTYTFDDKTATYKLPFAYIWGKPIRK